MARIPLEKDINLSNATMEDYYRWYVRKHRNLTEKEARKYGSTLEDQTLELKRIEKSTKLNEFKTLVGIEGDFSYIDGSETWFDKVITEPYGLVAELRDAAEWLRDNEPEQAKEVVLGLVSMVSRSIGAGIFGSGAGAGFDRVVEALIESSVNDWMGLQPGDSLESTLDNILASVSNNQNLIDDFRNQFSALVSVSTGNKILNQETIEALTELQFSSSAEHKTLSSKLNAITDQLDSISDQIGGVASLMMANMVVSLNLETADLPENETILELRSELFKAFKDGSIDQFKITYVKLRLETAKLKDKLETIQLNKKAEEAQKDYRAKLLMNDLSALIKLAIQAGKLIDDPVASRIVVSLATTIQSTLTVVASASSMGPIGIAASLVVIVLNFVTLLSSRSSPSPLQAVHEALSEQITDVYERLEEQLYSIESRTLINHNEIMREFRNLALNINAVLDGVSRIEGRLDSLSAQIDEVAQELVTRNLSDVKFLAKSAVSEFHDNVEGVKVSTIADLRRLWITVALNAPQSAIFSLPYSSVSGPVFDDIVARNDTTSHLLNVLDAEMAEITEHEMISTNHLNPETLMFLLPELEVFLHHCKNISNLSSTTYRRNMHSIWFRKCQEIIALRVCCMININLWRCLFNELLEIMNKYQAGVEHLFWDGQVFRTHIDDFYSSERNSILRSIGEQKLNVKLVNQVNGWSMPAEFDLPRSDFDETGMWVLAYERGFWRCRDKLGLVPWLPQTLHILGGTHPRNSDFLNLMGDIPDDPSYDHFSYSAHVFSFSTSDLTTLDQWRLMNFGPKDIGIANIYDPYSVNQYEWNQWYPLEPDYPAEHKDWSTFVDDENLLNRKLPKYIVDQMEFDPLDIYEAVESGNIQLESILNRSMFRSMVRHGSGDYNVLGPMYSVSATSVNQEEMNPEEYGRFDPENGFSISGFSDQYSNFFENFEKPNGFSSYSLEFSNKLETLFRQRLEYVGGKVSDGASDDANPNINFRGTSENPGILDNLNTTVSKIKQFIAFAFWDRPEIQLISKFLDNIEKQMEEFSVPAFSDFDPLQFVGSGFRPAMVKVTEDVRSLSGIIEHACLEQRSAVVNNERIEADFMGSNDCMKITDRIFYDFFGKGISPDELVNTRIDEAITRILNAPVKPPIGFDPDRELRNFEEDTSSIDWDAFNDLSIQMDILNLLDQLGDLPDFADVDIVPLMSDGFGASVVGGEKSNPDFIVQKKMDLSSSLINLLDTSGVKNSPELTNSIQMLNHRLLRGVGFSQGNPLPTEL